MSERSALWSPTAGLYAVALGLFAVSLAIGQSHGYQFAPGPAPGSLWRGDTTTGRIALCLPAGKVTDANMAAWERGFDVQRC